MDNIIDTIPNTIYLAKDSLKYAKGPPNLLRGYLDLELAMGSDMKTQKM